MELVSVCVVAYNSAKHLRRCLLSILSQTHRNLQVVVVDDGSTDSTGRICDEFAKADARVMAIHTPNQGASAARNTALAHASGEYVMWVDSDDCVDRTIVEQLLSLCKANNCLMSQCRYKKFSTTPPANALPEESAETVYEGNSIFHSRRHSAALWAKLCHRSLWLGIKFIPGQRYDDEEAYWRLYYQAGRVAATDLALYFYFDNPEGQMASMKDSPSADFIDIYLRRIDFFIAKGEEDLATLSRWRFCLSLISSHVHDKTTEGKKLFLSHFRKQYLPTLSCPKVPILHKLLFRFFALSPSLASAILGLCI